MLVYQRVKEMDDDSIFCTPGRFYKRGELVTATTRCLTMALKGVAQTTEIWIDLVTYLASMSSGTLRH